MSRHSAQSNVVDVEFRQSAQAPQNLEAERALLGGLLVDNRKFVGVLEMLPPLDQCCAPKDSRDWQKTEPLFAHPQNQEIFETIVREFAKGHGVDLTTLGAALDDGGRYEAVGGAPYLCLLEEELISTLYVLDYARIVREKWQARCAMRSAERIAWGISRGEDLTTLASTEIKRLEDVRDGLTKRDATEMPELFPNVIAEIEKRRLNAGEIIYIPTGLKCIDSVTRGLRPGMLTLIGARTSVGKTVLGTQIALHNALRGRHVHFFSYEMSEIELGERILAMISRVPLNKIMSGVLDGYEVNALHNAGDRFSSSTLAIDNRPELTIDALCNRARDLKRRDPKLELVIVDYVQLVPCGKSKRSREEELSDIGRKLKLIANELDIAVVGMVQLNRPEKEGKGKKEVTKPTIFSLRGSGDLENSANLIVLIHRYPLSSPNAEICIAKHRGGETFDYIPIRFMGPLVHFQEV